jgi:microcystin-dependent protein
MGKTRPSGTTPPVWLQTTQDATSDNPNFFGEMVRWFIYDGVNWLSPHPVPPNCPECRIWTGTEQALWSYDGGDGSDPSTNPPTANTGAMWVVETAFQFRFPLGVGTSPTGFDGNVPSAVAVLEQGGDERVTLGTNQAGPHKHELIAALDSSPTVVPITDSNQVSSRPVDNTVGFDVINGTSAPAANGLSGEMVGTTLSHQNMPPFVGVFFIKRSTRIYYTP